MQAQLIPARQLVALQPVRQRRNGEQDNRQKHRGDRPSSNKSVGRSIWTLFGKKQRVANSTIEPSTLGPTQQRQAHQQSLEAMERRLQQKLQLVHEGYKVRRIFITNAME